MPTTQHKELKPDVPTFLTNAELHRFADPWLFEHKTLPYEWQKELVSRLRKSTETP